MDFDSIIKWITETLPDMLSGWFDAAVNIVVPFWEKATLFVAIWIGNIVDYTTQAWQNFPALMADWNVAISAFFNGLRKSFPEFLPDSVLPVLETIPDWALFIVAPLVILLVVVFVLKKIFTASEKEEKHLKSVESPEVPTFGNPLPAEGEFVESEDRENVDRPNIPESERVDPVIRMETIGQDDPDPMERQAPTMARTPSVDDVPPDDADEEPQAPTTIGPAELQTRIREQLGIDEGVETRSNQLETESEASDAANLLDSNAEHDVSASLNKLRGLRPDPEPGAASLNTTGISEEGAAARNSPPSQEPEESVPDVLPEPHQSTTETPAISSEEPQINLTGSASVEPEDTAASPTKNAPPVEPEQPSAIPLAAMLPDVGPGDDDIGYPDGDEAEALKEEQIEAPVSSSGVPAPPGPLLATIERLEKGLRVNERLAAQDPANAQTQRDVAISQSRLADAMVEAGDLANAIPRFEQSLAISERLAEQNPLSAEALRDVAVSLNRLGDALANTGDIAGATVQYEMSLSVSQRIAEQSPANAQAQRDVWISLNRMGDVRSKAGNIDAAIAHFETGMQISKRLADFNLANVEAQRDLIVSYAKLAEVSPGQGWWARGLAVCEQLVAQGKLQPADSWMLEDLRRKSAADGT